MYESVIQQFFGEIATEMDNNVVKAVQEVGIYVDKDELIRALRYDRDQYHKGFNDGYEEFGEKYLRPKLTVHGEIDEYLGWYCPTCEEELPADGEWEHCPFCGQRLQWAFEHEEVEEDD